MAYGTTPIGDVISGKAPAKPEAAPPKAAPKASAPKAGPEKPPEKDGEAAYELNPGQLAAAQEIAGFLGLKPSQAEGIGQALCDFIRSSKRSH
jgi:hypothetical protein